MIDKKDYKYYTCRYDAAFKEVFIREDTSLLKAFLEGVLKIKINYLEIKNSELNNDNIHIERKLVDTIVYTDNEVFNIEINTSLDDSVLVRNTCYIMNTYSRYFLRGENYNSSRKFVQINLNYGRNNNSLFNEYKIMDKSLNILVNNFLIYHFNMDKYMEFWYNKNNKEIEKNKYLIMLDLSKEDLISLSKKDKVVSNYMERLNNVNEDPRFQSYMSAEEDDRKMLNTYKMKAEKAYDEGMNQGIKKTKKEICNFMIEKGYSKENISDILNINIDKIEKYIS